MSASRLEANHANAQLSTGPRTEEGKAKSCLNAVKTGLTGRTVVLPGDDTDGYQRHLSAFEQELQPVGLRECELAQSVADTWWRLRRIPALEMALFAKGRVEFADLFEEHELPARTHLIDAHTFLTYEKQIRNLQLQEARLARRREKETAELRALQQERKQKENEKMNPNGFEFSTSTARPLSGFDIVDQRVDLSVAQLLPERRHQSAAEFHSNHHILPARLPVAER
jgi:hypothetical protein